MSFFFSTGNIGLTYKLSGKNTTVSGIYRFWNGGSTDLYQTVRINGFKYL